MGCQLNSDQMFWIRVWLIIVPAVVVITIAEIVGGRFYWAEQDRLVADLVMSGVDPYLARCAIVGNETSNLTTCGLNELLEER